MGALRFLCLHVPGHSPDHLVLYEPTHQFLVDFQNIAFTGYFQGGGYLRTLQFDTDANRINVQTYSPVIGTYQTDADSQFTLKVDFAKRFGLPNGGGTTNVVSTMGTNSAHISQGRCR